MSVFIDKAKISVQAGRGGDGAVAWRREKFIDKGGPAGGDGGNGGSVILVGDKDLNTLQSFRFNEAIKAENGESGARQKKHGKSGKETEVKVPLGTQVFEGELMVFDITEDGQKAVVAKGGQGGFGNAHFKSSVRQSPRIVEQGAVGEKFELGLELKLLADVGIIGLPNAGKSTLLSVISNARPAIADYPFTTLVPYLGVVDVAGGSLLFADIPGLIEGASQGKGLGLDFLRHIERTAVLVQLIDAYSEDVAKDYKVIENELASYKINLKNKARVVVLSKIDGLDKKTLATKQKTLAKASGSEVIMLSAHTKDGIYDLLDKAVISVKKYREQERAALDNKDGDDTIYVTLDDESDWKVDKTRSGWVISGKKIESFASRTKADNFWSVQRLKDIMQRQGIMHELARRGAQPGDQLQIGKLEIEL